MCGLRKINDPGDHLLVQSMGKKGGGTKIEAASRRVAPPRPSRRKHVNGECVRRTIRPEN